MAKAAQATINMRELRDTKRLKALLRAGKTVELRDRSTVIGRIVPPTPEPIPAVEWPDFAARRKAIFGNRVFNAVEMLIEERNR